MATSYNRYTDFADGMWPDTPGALIPNGGVYTALDMLFDRPGKARKRGGTYATNDLAIGFRYLAAMQPGIGVLTNKVMGVNGYVEDATFKVALSEPNFAHVATTATAHNNESYVLFLVGTDNSGTLTGATSGGGASFSLANYSTTANTGAYIGVAYDVAESGHSSADLPVMQLEYQFFTPPPSNFYGILLGIGDLAGVGVETTTRRLPSNAYVGNSATAAGNGLSGSNIPVAGNLLMVFITVNGQTITGPPTDLSATGYDLVYSGTSAGGMHNYVYSKIAVGDEGTPTTGPWTVSVPLSGSTHWGITIAAFSTPSSDNVYLIDEAALGISFGGAFNPALANFTADGHGTGVVGSFGGDIYHYPTSNPDFDTLVGKPWSFDGFLFAPVKSRTEDANFSVVYGGVDLTATHQPTYEPAGDCAVTVTLGSQKITTTGTTFTSKSDVGDMVVIRDDVTSPLYGYAGRITKIVDDTTIYVTPTPTVTAVYHNSGALKTAPAVLLPDHYGLSPLSSDIGCAWQFRNVYAAPSPWTATASVTGPTDYTRTIIWSTLATETVSAHTGLYLDGMAQAFRESIMPNNFLHLPEAQPFTAMAPLFSTQLVLFGYSDMWAVTGEFTTNDSLSTGDNLSVFNISKTVGCINKDSLQSTPHGLCFASHSGVMIYDGKSTHPLMTNRLANAFRDSLEAGATVIGSGLIRANHYVLSMSDVTYMVNLDNGAWTTLSNISIFDSIDDPADPSKCYVALEADIDGDPDTDWPLMAGGQVVRVSDIFLPSATNTADANGTTVTSSLETRTYSEGDPEALKFYQAVMYEYYKQGAGAVSVSGDTSLEPSRASYVSIGTLPQNAALAITGATNASPIVITTATHGYATGDHVMIRNVLGNTEANGKWVITVLSPTTFSLNSSTGNAAYTSGGTAKQDEAKAFNVKPLLKTGYGITTFFQQTGAVSQFEVLGIKHGFRSLRPGRGS